MDEFCLLVRNRSRIEAPWWLEIEAWPETSISYWNSRVFLDGLIFRSEEVVLGELFMETPLLFPMEPAMIRSPLQQFPCPRSPFHELSLGQVFWLALSLDETQAHVFSSVLFKELITRFCELSCSERLTVLTLASLRMGFPPMRPNLDYKI